MNFYCEKMHYWDATPNSILHTKSGCPVCSRRRIISGYNDLWTVRPDVAELLVNKDDGYKYGISNEEKTEFRCRNCGSILVKSVFAVCTSGLYCEFCDDGLSYPNKFMRSILNQLSISYIPEYNPDWIKPKLYDFYFVIAGKQYIVEMDGGLGHGNQPNNSMTTLTKEESIAIDKYKDKCAKEHDIDLLRIDCNYPYNIERFEYIKNNIITSKLSEVLNLEFVDFDQANKDAESTLLFQISKLWDSGVNNTKSIGDILHINVNTVMRYLKKSEKLGVSTYNHFEYLWEHHKLSYVTCLETSEIAMSINQVNTKYHCNLYQHLVGKSNYAGTLSDGTKLHWRRLSKEETYDVYINAHA